MLLEMVKPHKKREDLYCNNVLVPDPLVKKRDRKVIKNILRKEFPLETLFPNSFFKNS